MENASRALLMAGGVLMAILVISMLVLMFSNLTNVFSEKNQANREEQIVKFNMEYESYNRKDDKNTYKNEGVRGTEILSLLAKVHDYNMYQSDYEGTNAGYSPITVKINMNDEENNFKYNEKDKLKIERNYIQGKNNNQNAYNNILTIKTNAKEMLEDIGGSRKKSKEDKAELSDSDLETLTASLSLIENTKQLLSPNKNDYSVSELNQIQKTLALMQRIFNPTNPPIESDEDLKDNENPKNNLKITNSNDTGITELRNFLNDTRYNKIEENIKNYYQYQQFKKSYFDCEGVTYDENTGRVKQLNFKYTGTGD